MKLDVTPHQIRFSVLPTDMFVRDTIRYGKVDRMPEERGMQVLQDMGIRLLVGKLRAKHIPTGYNPNSRVLKSIYFDRAMWDQESAIEWLQDHMDLIEYTQKERAIMAKKRKRRSNGAFGEGKIVWVHGKYGIPGQWAIVKGYDATQNAYIVHLLCDNKMDYPHASIVTEAPYMKPRRSNPISGSGVVSRVKMPAATVLSAMAGEEVVYSGGFKMGSKNLGRRLADALKALGYTKSQFNQVEKMLTSSGIIQGGFAIEPEKKEPPKKKAAPKKKAEPKPKPEKKAAPKKRAKKSAAPAVEKKLEKLEVEKKQAEVDTAQAKAVEAAAKADKAVAEAVVAEKKAEVAAPIQTGQIPHDFIAQMRAALAEELGAGGV